MYKKSFHSRLKGNDYLQRNGSRRLDSLLKILHRYNNDMQSRYVHYQVMKTPEEHARRCQEDIARAERIPENDIRETTGKDSVCRQFSVMSEKVENNKSYTIEVTNDGCDAWCDCERFKSGGTDLCKHIAAIYKKHGLKASWQHSKPLTKSQG